MANVISNISVMLSANAGAVKRGVSEAKGALSGYGRHAKGMAGGNPFSGAQKGATGLTGSIVGLTGKLGALGAAFGVAFSAKAMAGGIAASWEMMDSQKELADQLGISVKALSGLSYISDVVGGDTAALSGSIAKMQKLFGNAANGQKAATDTLAKYGMTAKELIGLPIEEQMGIISDKFKTLNSQEQKVVMATDLFGKSGASMINMLSLGSGEIDTMIKKAKDLGVVFSDDAAQGASDAEDAILELGMRATGFKNIMATELAPVMIDFVGWLDKVAAHGAGGSGAKSGMENLAESAMATAALISQVMIPLPVRAALGGGDPLAIPKSLMGGQSAKPSGGAGKGMFAPAEATPGDPLTGSMVDSIFSPKKMAAGSGVMSQSGKDMAAQQGKDYIDSFYDSIRAGGTGDPQLDHAKALAEQFHQDHKQRLLDLEAIAKEEELSKKAAEGMSNIFKEGADALEDQKKALEASKRIEGGFMIGKRGRTAFGGGGQSGGGEGGIPNIDIPRIDIPMMNIPQIGISKIGGTSTYGGANGNGSGMSKDGQIVSELQEQTNYLRQIAAKPQVASFA